MGGRALSVQALRFEPAPVEAMAAHARACYPDECCGLFLGPSGEAGAVTEIVRITNVQNDKHAEDPASYPRDARTAYLMDPGEHVRAERAAPGRGLEVRGVYHSHPDHGVYFSPEDRAQATPFGDPTYPAYVVVSVTADGVAGGSQFVWDPASEDFVEVALAHLAVESAPAGAGPLPAEPAPTTGAGS